MNKRKKQNPIEQRIIQTFMDLSKQMPIEKISVSELCRKCGIQRQTFYNHYSDVDNLIESIFDREGYRIFETTRTYHGWQDGMYEILINLKKNKDFVNAVYQGVSREQLETRLYSQVRVLLMDIVNEMGGINEITDEDKNYIVEYHKYAFAGTILDWIRYGMKEDPKEIVNNIEIVIHGSIPEAIERYAKLAKKSLNHKMDRKPKVSI